MSRHQTSLKADRLRTVLFYLRAMCERGASSRDLLIHCNINRASDAIYDLRHPGDGGTGIEIASAWETRNGKTYKRYWLAEHAPAEAVEAA